MSLDATLSCHVHKHKFTLPLSITSLQVSLSTMAAEQPPPKLPPLDAAPTASKKANGSSSSNPLDANRALAAQAAQTKISKAQKKKMEKEISVDSTVYEYDEVWDRMQEAKASKQANPTPC